MNPGLQRSLHDIRIYVSPFLMMALLLAVTSIPGESSGIPRDAGLFSRPISHLVSLFSLIPPTVHDILHVPGFMMLAWTLYLPLRRWLKPTP